MSVPSSTTYGIASFLALRSAAPSLGERADRSFFPPGTSKWNKIEHRLFSHITMNWRGRPLTSHEVVVNTIASTKTRTGLRVEAELDTASYPLGVMVGKARFAELPIQAHATCGTWNYTIFPDRPTAADRPLVVGTDRAQIRAAALRVVADPRLTGMTQAQLDDLAHRLAPAQAAQAEQRTFHQRGGERRRAKAPVPKPCSPMRTGR